MNTIIRFLPVIATVILLSACGRTSVQIEPLRGDAMVDEQARQRILHAWSLETYDPSFDKFAPNEAFRAHFKPIGILRLTDSLLLGNPREFDIDADGDLLMLDRTRSQAILYAADGSVRRVLEPESCHPGYEFRPIRARFGPGGEIVVASNFKPGGFTFDSDGECGHAFDLHTRTPDDLVIADDGGIYVYEAGFDGSSVYRVGEDDLQTELWKSEDFKTLNDRYKGLTQWSIYRKPDWH